MSAIIESAADVLRILRDLLEHPAPLETYTVPEFAQKYGMDYQKARRIVLTLAHHGFLQKKDESYFLSDFVVMLAKRYFIALARLNEEVVAKAKQFSEEIIPPSNGDDALPSGAGMSWQKYNS